MVGAPQLLATARADRTRRAFAMLAAAGWQKADFADRFFAEVMVVH
jgi:hypothetical protein